MARRYREFTFTVTDPDGKKADPETLNDIYTIKTEVEPEDAGEYDLLIDCVGVGEGDYDVVIDTCKIVYRESRCRFNLGYRWNDYGWRRQYSH